MLDSLFDRFSHIIVFDTETTGIAHKTDEIIELAMTRLVPGESAPAEDDSFDHFIRLTPGRTLPPEIVKLTGITPETLDREGHPKKETARRLMELLDCEKPLLVAYNAQFDLCFIYYFLSRYGDPSVLKRVKMLDALSVYKDRRPYPHKLQNAVDAYQLQTQNTHRAIDDARATVELLLAMEAERPDLEKYINLFGYNPKYGVSGPRIGSITYLPQSYDPKGRLYEK